MTPDTRVTISPSVYARPFGDELVLLEFGRGEYYALDALGAAIWRALEAGRSLGEITEMVVRERDVEPATAFRDIVDLVTHMRDGALLAVGDR